MVTSGKNTLILQSKEILAHKGESLGCRPPQRALRASLLANLTQAAWQKKQSGLHINTLLNTRVVPDKHQPITALLL